MVDVNDPSFSHPLSVRASLELREPDNFSAFVFSPLIGGFFHFSERMTTPTRKISMNPDLTLLIGGFIGHKEIKSQTWFL